MLGIIAVWLLAVAPELDAPVTWLTWAAPPECPGAAVVEGSVRERLGRDVEPGEIEAVAEVKDEGSAGYRLTLRTRRDGAEDRRELSAHDCRALADATGLVIALTIDAVAVAEQIGGAPAEPPEDLAVVPDPGAAAQAEAEAAPEIEPAPEAAPESTVRAGGAAGQPRAPQGRSDRSRTPAFALALAGGGILGTLPGISGGPELGAALLWRRLRLELAGAWLAPRTERQGDASVGVQLGIATARACGRLGTARVEVPLCGGLELGALRGDGDGAPGARTAHGLWLAPVLGGGVRGWVTERLAPFARLDVSIPVAHPAFELRSTDDRVEIFRASPVSGRLWLGLEVKLSGLP